MYSGKLVFAQVMDHLPLHTLGLLTGQPWVDGLLDVPVRNGSVPVDSVPACLKLTPTKSHRLPRTEKTPTLPPALRPLPRRIRGQQSWRRPEGRSRILREAACSCS